MGCIALEDIEIGTLILKEKPQCISKNGIMDMDINGYQVVRDNHQRNKDHY